MATCPKCFLNGCYPCEELANQSISDPLLIGCEDASMGTSILFVSLLNYLQRNPNAHVVLIRKQEIGYGFRLRLLQFQNRSSPLLKQIHIKYLSSASELNQFIVASRLSYEYDLLAIDNWGDFFKESTAVVKMSKTLGLLKELGVPSLLLDNQLNSTALKEYDSFFRILSIPLAF
ncbi:hypothetical protein WA577_006751 [Blastocystis sp. JDR]